MLLGKRVWLLRCKLFVNVTVKSDLHDHPWLITFVHGPTAWNDKEKFCYDLEYYGNVFRGPWLCLGNFNAIMNQYEKWGGRPVGSSSIGNALNQFLWNSGMLDLGFSGNPYTWTNGREGRGLIMERLDRGVANEGWRTLFPRAIISHNPRHALDHAPIILNTFGDNDSEKFGLDLTFTRG